MNDFAVFSHITKIIYFPQAGFITPDLIFYPSQRIL
ncbi:hypothetical protein FIC_02188 [Flavobacteriaceae bacterium 3519-10]|nr:hypothetical protein FIC_02188 [Flavobacteriaceae bacterium 3519-10]